MNEITTNKQDMLVPDKADNSNIRNLVYMIRGQQVMLDSNLACLYKVEAESLNRAVKRNEERFPDDFCFQLTKSEYENLKCQIGISRENLSEVYLKSTVNQYFGISRLADPIMGLSLITQQIVA